MKAESSLVFLPGWGFQSSIGREFLSPQTSFMDLPQAMPCIETVCQLIEGVLPNHPILIGWSGVLLSLKLYERNPHAYRALILITSTSCFGVQKNWPGISNEHRTILRECLRKAMRSFSLITSR